MNASRYASPNDANPRPPQGREHPDSPGQPAAVPLPETGRENPRATPSGAPDRNRDGKDWGQEADSPVQAGSRKVSLEAQIQGIRRDARARFLTPSEWLEHYAIPVTESGCWLYQGSLRRKDYGAIWFDGATHPAHRVSWMIFRGVIPSGLFVCHRCDVPCCINPHHLFLGTNSDNMKDMQKKGRANYVSTPGKPHVPKDGHERVFTGKGKRYCLICHRASIRRSRDKAKRLRMVEKGTG
jgi:hypothetical protein